MAVMKYSTHFTVFLGLAFLTMAGCSERVENPIIKAHGPTWNETESPDFHGIPVTNNSPTSCVSCHGEELDGESGVPGCYECHDGPGGHPAGWADALQHGREARLNGSESCQPCHGVDYTGGWSEVSCYQCHDGPTGAHPEANDKTC